MSIGNRKKVSGRGGSVLGKVLNSILLLAIVGTLGALVYITAPKAGEAFTEFYILGINGKASDYPSVFVMQQGQVTGVSYDSGATFTAGQIGKVSLGVVNHEQRDVSYSMMLKIDGQPVNIFMGETSHPLLEGISLSHGDTWEAEIGFVPQKTGSNQNVQFFLLKDGAVAADNTLHLRIDVRG